MGKEKRPGDAKLSTEERLIERLVIIILKVDCGGDGEDDEEIDITRLYRWQRGKEGGKI